MIGYQLKWHQRTKKKVVWYNIEPKDMTAKLLPWAEFKLDEVSMPEKKCPFLRLEHVPLAVSPSSVATELEDVACNGTVGNQWTCTSCTYQKNNLRKGM
jgi:hypothetical protein